ncbi:ParB N-terminal domain-containing protein [Rhizobium sp. PRIMUS64]|uniref:DUF6551 family protein n=1 Tax=Rhizobium sp. PRIMUS64 TaxID=2908925 RepID=UPI001FF48659|nr:DUF6551 family protein [Rhizobium sp. PRIMUS64]MCJ9696232.1 ParB N-terminal domain-containing protein [Rhizobium sp. PRIMUS64]
MRPVSFSDKDAVAEISAGPAPMLQWLKIADLRVDDSYQRDLKRENWTAIRRIAANFRWSRFSPVFVAPIEGGQYAIIDGQHRTHAAAMCGFETVPCQVVQMSHEEQAEAFAAVNGEATKVTLWNLYKASLAAGTEWAVKIQTAAAAAGCSVAVSNASTASKKAGEIYAVEGFRRSVEKHGQTTVTAALKALSAVNGWREEAVYWEAGILLPILNTLCRRPALLDLDDFPGVFEEFPLWKHIDEIAEDNKKAVRSGTKPRARSEQLQDRLLVLLGS